MGTHSRGEGAYRSSCDARCCWRGEYIHSGSYLILTLTTWVHPFWLISYTYTDDVSTSILAHILYLHWRREYIHSGSYLILTLTTWVHPFWLISYTYTDDVSTSILAHALYSYTLHIHTADESMSCICLMKYLCAPTWWAVFVYLNRIKDADLAARWGHTAVVRELIEAHAILPLGGDTQPWLRELIEAHATMLLSTSILAHILYLHWRREYIHSGSYLILTLTTWVHPFWLISFTNTDDVSTSILAHILYLHWRREYIHSGSYLILTLTTSVHPFLLMLYTATHYIYIQQMSLCHVSVWWSICVLPHDGLCLSIWIESTHAVTSCRSVGTHSCGEGAYRSSCHGRCCWLREYIHSGSYLILTLTTWVHPFLFMLYTATQCMHTSDGFVSYVWWIISVRHMMGCVCLFI